MNLWTPIKRLLGRVFGWLRPRPAEPPRFRFVLSEDLPEKVEPLTIVAVGEGKHLWYAVLACPCGCGETVQLSLLQDERPRWRLTERDGVPTLSPSVWRHRGCRSHFILRDGLVTWC